MAARDRRNTLQSQLAPRFISVYTKLLKGVAPSTISPNVEHERFWSELLTLQVDREFLLQQINALHKEDCMGRLKSPLNTLFRECVAFARKAAYDDPKKSNSIETISILSRCILRKDLTGWEVMEVFAGGVHASDQFFMDMVELIRELLSDEAAPVSIRHQTLQLGVIFMCGVGQLSPGAYFLRRDLFPSICDFVKHRNTRQYAFEAALFLCLLANFHRSDSAKLNPYVHHIHETVDVDAMRTISIACKFAVVTSVKAYWSISDDSEPTFMSAVGTLVTSLRPDRAFSSKPVDPPRELFKDQPIEATLALLPVYEFLHSNQVFASLLLEELHMPSEKATSPTVTSPLLLILLTLSSYLLTHATSSSTPRSAAYGTMALHLLNVMMDNDAIFRAFCEPHKINIRICRQRLPVLPAQSPPRAPLCAVLDCCVLWLRHNLHKKLQTSSYIICVRICYRTLWMLRRDGVRIDYHWQELWRAVIGLLDFLTRSDITTTGGSLFQLQHETLLLVDFVLCNCEALLPSPPAIHECIYELVRSISTLKKQNVQPDTASASRPMHGRHRQSSGSEEAYDPLAHVLRTVAFYEEKVHSANARSAKEAMRILAKHVDSEGVLGSQDAGQFAEPWIRNEDLSGFAKYAAIDGLSLMP